MGVFRYCSKGQATGRYVLVLRTDHSLPRDMLCNSLQRAVGDDYPLRWISEASPLGLCKTPRGQAWASATSKLSVEDPLIVDSGRLHHSHLHVQMPTVGGKVLYRFAIRRSCRRSVVIPKGDLQEVQLAQALPGEQIQWPSSRTRRTRINAPLVGGLGKESSAEKWDRQVCVEQPRVRQPHARELASPHPTAAGEESL